MMDGLLGLSPWGCLLAVLILTHITIAAVTIFLHRCQAHRALELHPAVSHFFRLWLWLTTGMVTREWVAIHRKHHARCETESDPHSPQILGLPTVLWRGAELYKRESENEQTLERFGAGTPDDWMERNVYSRYPNGGIVLLMAINLLLFGPLGLTVWAVQMVWIPFWAAGVINGVGHYWGYRNYETKDASKNISPWGILIGGEELHNNHHAFPNSARLSNKVWEFDIGWAYIRLLSLLRLAEVRQVAPQPNIRSDKDAIDVDTVRAVLINRMYVMARYARTVTIPVLKSELRRVDASYRRLLKSARAGLVRDGSQVGEAEQKNLAEALVCSASLRVVYEYRQRLQQIWTRATAGQENAMRALQEWCSQAEASGVQALQDFARSLRNYSLKPGGGVSAQ